MASIDKSWIQLKNRASLEYMDRVRKFAQYAEDNVKDEDGKIRCPCTVCSNVCRLTIGEVETHLLRKGMRSDYTKWVYHGEGDDEDEDENETDDVDMDLDDMLGVLNHLLPPQPDPEPEDPNEEAQKFYRLFGEAQSPLYEGCDPKLSRLSCIVKLMNMKWLNSWTDHSFTEFLKFIRSAFPMAESLPKNYYASKQLMKGLGLHCK
ncbi:unnamed protein product [Linum trigynum]|uniref:Transposase-associated domain-containing protein n=1 Tax=Linum trigynum TaxID=586398 RepID=A0AAV2FWK3_9ROSI